MLIGKIRWLLFVFFILGCNQIFAQFQRPKKIKSLTQTQLILEETEDAKFLLENISNYQHIEKIRIDGEVDIAIACKALSLIDAVQDLELTKFDGILSDEDIQNIEWIPNLFIYIPTDREDAFLLNPAWQYIRNAVIEFQEIPEDFEFFQGWKSIKYLCLLGDFNANNVQNAALAIRNYIPKIEEIGFSLLDIKDMPMSLSELPYLNSVEIYNSIDIAQGHDWDNLGEVTRPLFKVFDTIYLDPHQHDAFVTKPLFITLHYFAFEPEITTSQEKYIESIFPTKSYSDEYLWYEEETKKSSDFLQFIGANLTDYKPTQSFQSAVLREYSENDAVYLGKGDSNCMFLTPNLGALIIPANSLELNTGYPFSGPYSVHIATANKLEDLFAEGVSLQLDSIGKIYSINPEYWINITINSNDTKQPLRIKPGNFLQFTYLTENKNKGAFYSLNSNSRRWENFYEYDYQFDDEKLRAIDFYKIAHDQKQHTSQIAYMGYSLDERFELAGFNYMLNPGEEKIKIKKENGFWINRITNKGDKTVQLVRGRPMFKLRLLPKQKNAPKFQDFKLMPYDRGLMPEWNELEEIVFSFESNLNKKEITKILSKKRWLDLRIVESQGFYAMELKTQNGFYEIQLAHPLERYKVLSDGGKKMNRKIRNALNEYFNKRNMKALTMLMFEKQKSSLIKSSQYSKLFDRGNSKNEIVKSFKIRSLGEFSIGVVVPCDLELNAEIILSDYGKVALNPSRVWIYFKNSSSVELKVSPRISFNYNVKDIAAILAETTNTSSSQFTKSEKNINTIYYYLSGKDLLTQGIAPNKIMYLSLKPLPQNFKNHNELSDFMNWDSLKKQKKLKKARNK